MGFLLQVVLLLLLLLLVLQYLVSPTLLSEDVPYSVPPTRATRGVSDPVLS